MYSKGFLLLTAIVCVTVAEDKTIAIKISPQQVLELRSGAKDCAEKTGVDPGILIKVINWKFDEDEASKAFVYCLSTNTGYVDTNGNVNVSKLLETELVKGKQEDYIKKLNECTNIKKENKIDTVFEFGNCFYGFVEVIVVKPSS